MTMRQAVARALTQNPDIALARLDQKEAESQIQIARDPFVPRVVAGSGLAYNNGFPLSVEGSAPSVFEIQANQYLLNRQQSWQVAKAREAAKGAAISAESSRDAVARRTAQLFLDAERSRREAEMARKQVESLEKVAAAIRSKVEAGRELEVENKRAAVNLARARQRLQLLEFQQAQAEQNLASVLGFAEGDQVRPEEETREKLPVPESEDGAVHQALDSSTELRKIESDLKAQGFEIKSEQAAKLPRLDLIGKYSLLARFNNYEDFFRTFKRHNALIGMSFQVPLPFGPAKSALAEQAEDNVARLRLEQTSARQRISLETRRLYRQLRQAETSREVARLDLDLAREQLSVLLAQFDEGRATLRQVEEARFAENERWIAYFEAEYGTEEARLALLAQTGSLIASLR